MRIAALILGGLWLFWLPLEDHKLLGVFLFAIAISILITLRFTHSQFWGRWLPGIRIIFLGGLWGSLIVPLALFLMALKNGLHGHASPEYSSGQILNVIKSFPYWILLGGIMGAVVYLLLGKVKKGD